MSDFKKAIQLIIQVHEGGFQDRKDDPGNFTPSGELKGTKFGISAASFPQENIKELTLEAAEELYRRHWGRFAALYNQRVMTKVLDLAVNMQFGTTGPATFLLQKALVVLGWEVKIDGVFGADTITKANDAPVEALLAQLCLVAQSHYREIADKNPKMIHWAHGWDERAIWVPPLDPKA